jgi:hypothetical protein
MADWTFKTVENTGTMQRRTRLPPGSSAKAFGSAIEEMEIEGQRQLVKSDVIPWKGAEHPSDMRDVMITQGFEFHGRVENDALFQYVTLPEGWKVRPTDHYLWTHIEDEHGEDRYAMFYKAAFYDRRARICAR